MKECLLKETLPITPREFYSLFFEKEDFFVRFHKSIGNKNVEVSAWAQAPENRQQRTVRYQALATSPASLLRFSNRKAKRQEGQQDLVPVREIQLVYFTHGEFHCSSMRDSFEFRSEWVVSPTKVGCECKILVKCDYKGVLLQDLETRASKQTREAHTQLLALALTEAEAYKKDRVSQGSNGEDDAFVDSDSSSFDVGMLNYDSDRSDVDSTMSSEHVYEGTVHEFPISRNSSEKQVEDESYFYDAEDTLALSTLPEQIKESAVESVVLSLQNEVTQLRTLVETTYSRMFKFESTVKQTQQQLLQQQLQHQQIQQHQQQQTPNMTDSLNRSTSSPAIASQLVSGGQAPQFYSYYLSRLEDLTKQLDEEQRKRKELERLLVAKHKDLDAKIRQIRDEGHSAMALSPWLLRGCTLGAVVLLFALTTRIPAASTPTNSFIGWLLTPLNRLRDYFQSSTPLLTR